MTQASSRRPPVTVQPRRHRLAAFIAALTLALPAAGLLTPTAALAQAAWPTAKPITLIVPFTAGGSVDFNARMIAGQLRDRLKQSVVVENVAGAGGAIGLGRAAKAAPDGYTLVAGPDSGIAIGKMVNPAAYSSFDPIKDLTPIGLMNTAPMVLIARPGLGVDSLDAYLKLAKSKPGQLTYATSGIGTVLQLAMEQIKQRTGIFVTHIPYRGGAQIATDVIGNQVDSAMLISISAMPHIQAGRVKALAVTGPARLASLPAVPTVGENPALKGYNMLSWTGLFAPAGTPPAIVERINRELQAVLAEPEVVAKLRDQGAEPGKGSPTDFSRFIAAEVARNRTIIDKAGIKE